MCELISHVKVLLTSLRTQVINSRRALTLHIQSHNLGILVTYEPHIKAWKVCKEGLVEDGYHLLFICFAYSAFRESYDDLLRGSDDLIVTLNITCRRRAHMCLSYSHIERIPHSIE